MKPDTAHLFQKLRSHALSLPLLLTLLLLSCAEEQGDWTAVHQEAEYLYGVWHSGTRKRTEETLHTLSANIRNAPTALATAENTRHTDISPLTLLPEAEPRAAWLQSRKPSTYTGAELYRDRPTSPRLYFAYGFQRQAEVEYQTPRFGSKPLILLEVFDMGTPENAFGLYNFHLYPDVKIEWVGSKAILSGGYLRFAKGKYFVQIEGYEFATGIREAMIHLAKDIAAQIQDPPPKPELLALLPRNKVNGSSKLFTSNWALSQIYSTLPTHVPQITDNALGVSARYRENADSKNWLEAQIAFVIRFPTAEAATIAYTLYKDALAAAAAPIALTEHGAILVDETAVPTPGDTARARPPFSDR